VSLGLLGEVKAMTSPLVIVFVSAGIVKAIEPVLMVGSIDPETTTKDLGNSFIGIIGERIVKTKKSKTRKTSHSTTFTIDFIFSLSI
jgi:hypothetical protein